MNIILYKSGNIIDLFENVYLNDIDVLLLFV